MFYTTDINELVNLSHRVYVMADGEVSAELRASDITEENVLRAAFASRTATAVGAPAGERALQSGAL